jgi:hypothetical protein
VPYSNPLRLFANHSIEFHCSTSIETPHSPLGVRATWKMNITIVPIHQLILQQFQQLNGMIVAIIEYIEGLEYERPSHEMDDI